MDFSCPEFPSHFHLASDLLCFSTIVRFLNLMDLIPIDWFPFLVFLCCFFLIGTPLVTVFSFISPTMLYRSPYKSILVSIFSLFQVLTSLQHPDTSHFRELSAIF